MDPADDIAGAAQASPLWARYGTRAEAQSAREMLAGRLAEPEPEPEPAPASEPMDHVPLPRRRRSPRRAPAPAGGADAIGDFLSSRQGKALQREVVRGLFGMLRKRL